MDTKKERKAHKKAFKKAKRKYVQPWKALTIILIVLSLITTAASVVLNMFDNTAVLFLGGTFWEVIDEDPNAQYFTSEFKSDEERIAAGAKLGYQMEAEGAALLTNNGALPLEKGSKVSLFSISSVNPVFGGTGSGNVDASKAVNLKDALVNAGVKVNETLWNFYSSEEISSTYGRGGAAGGQVKDSAAAAMLGMGSSINEVPWDKYPADVLDTVNEYGDAAIVVFSRIGGEGADCTFDGMNYLALEEAEREMMANLKALKDAGKIKNIVVLINTSNALQVDFMKNNEYGVDSLLWIGGTGGYGLEAVGDIIAGNVNPSGSLVDTYLFNNYASPAMQNFVPTTYAGYEEGIIPSSAETYMIYQEGIYVGHKYFETRYEDYVMGTGNAGNYKYHDSVAYPFGYGLSYTSFEYSNMTSTYNAVTDTFEVKVTVTNTGKVAGKETVQIYLNSPYTEYDQKNKVEKASASLVGFDKTDILKPGESETLTISIDRREFASYDTYGYKTYILDAGDYLLTAATDAHNAVNNFLAAKGYTPENTNGKMDAAGNAALVTTWNNPEMDALTYAITDDGDAITNQLSIADPNLNDGVEEEVTWLSRSDWENTFPKEIVKFTLTEKLIDALQEVLYDSADHTPVEMPTLNAGNDITLYDMIGKDYDDPAWDTLLDNLTFDEMVSLIADSFHWTMPIESIQAPGSRDENGPQGLTVTLFGAGLDVDETVALTSEDVMAATFNKDLVYAIGQIVGEDCLAGKVSILYGPGANIHRTPYSGRNFEYYSEDAFLSSEIGRYEVAGIESKGVRVVMKHFALNDCEQDRLGQAAWLTEQAAREIYLKAFQGALENENGNGVMLAYTRWGTQWSGSVPGLNHIVRKEWNNNGLNITDNVLTGYVNSVDAVFGVTTTCDAMMSFMTIGKLEEYENDPIVVNAMREASHHNLYALANSIAMNGIGSDTTIKAVTPKLIKTIQTANIVCLAATVVCAVLWILNSMKFKKTNAYYDYKEYKASLKK